jgi:hypothetical protein
VSVKPPFQISDTDACIITKVTDRSSYIEVLVLLKGSLLLVMSKILNPFHARIHDTVALTIDMDGPNCTCSLNQASISLDIGDAIALGHREHPSLCRLSSALADNMCHQKPQEILSDLLHRLKPKLFRCAVQKRVFRRTHRPSYRREWRASHSPRLLGADEVRRNQSPQAWLVLPVGARI